MRRVFGNTAIASVMREKEKAKPYVRREQFVDAGE
jgi:hypothetical protein